MGGDDGALDDFGRGVGLDPVKQVKFKACGFEAFERAVDQPGIDDALIGHHKRALHACTDNLAKPRSGASFKDDFRNGVEGEVHYFFNCSILMFLPSRTNLYIVSSTINCRK